MLLPWQALGPCSNVLHTRELATWNIGLLHPRP